MDALKTVLQLVFAAIALVALYQLWMVLQGGLQAGWETSVIILTALAATKVFCCCLWGCHKKMK